MKYNTTISFQKVYFLFSFWILSLFLNMVGKFLFKYCISFYHIFFLLAMLSAQTKLWKWKDERHKSRHFVRYLSKICLILASFSVCWEIIWRDFHTWSVENILLSSNRCLISQNYFSQTYNVIYKKSFKGLLDFW